MDTLNDFLSSKGFKLVVSSAVFAALVTSIFNYVSIQSTNERLYNIERQKHLYEITTYRLTALRSALDDLSKLESPAKAWQSAILGKADLRDIVIAQTKRSMEVQSIYERNVPFLDRDLIDAIERMRQREEDESLKMATLLDAPTDVLKRQLALVTKLRVDVEKQLRKSIQEQIARLISKT